MRRSFRASFESEFSENFPKDRRNATTTRMLVVASRIFVVFIGALVF
jgi:hypothetical protein